MIGATWIDPLAGLLGAGLAAWRARVAVWRLREGKAGGTGCASLGLALMLLARTMTALRTPPPTLHAYNAVVAVMIGHAVFHIVVALVIRAFVAHRRRTGYLSPARSAEMRIVQLWGDYGSGAGAIVLLAVHLPGLIA